MSLCVDFKNKEEMSCSNRSQPWRGALAFYSCLGFMIVGAILTYHFWR